MPSDTRKSRSPVTYDAIAARAEVSKTTVSLVLRGLARDRIPAATYARVEAASRELGYYPNRLVQAMQKGRTETIAVIAPSMWMEHAGRILDGVREEAARHGYSILLGSASGNADEERASAERLLQHRADGLIRFGAAPDPGKAPDWLAEAVERGVPCVVVDDGALAGQIDCVVSDDAQGAEDAVRHLIERGRRRIAHLGGDPGRTSAEERAEGYRRAVRGAGLAYERIEGRRYDGEGLEEALEALFDDPEQPDALFVCADPLAVDAQNWLRTRGLRVPEDVALVGFAGSWNAREADLSTVEQPFGPMGECAVRRLVGRIEDDATPYGVDRLPTRLVVRASSGGETAGGVREAATAYRIQSGE